MGLEEQTVEGLGETCEVCGARLTDDELQAALESGGPLLCTVHAAELADQSEEDAPAGGGTAPD